MRYVHIICPCDIYMIYKPRIRGNDVAVDIVATSVVVNFGIETCLWVLLHIIMLVVTS